MRDFTAGHVHMAMHACMVTKRLCKLYVCVCATNMKHMTYIWGYIYSKAKLHFPRHCWQYEMCPKKHLFGFHCRFGVLIAAPNRCRVHTNGPNMFCGIGYRKYVFTFGVFLFTNNHVPQWALQNQNAKLYPMGNNIRQSSKYFANKLQQRSRNTSGPVDF